MEKGNNLMSKAHAAPRCTATSKRTGIRCKGPAVRGWRVCRFHGAKGGHPKGEGHPSWVHGARSKEARAACALASNLAKSAAQTLAAVSDIESTDESN